MDAKEKEPLRGVSAKINQTQCMHMMILVWMHQFAPLLFAKQEARSEFVDCYTNQEKINHCWDDPDRDLYLYSDNVLPAHSIQLWLQRPLIVRAFKT